MGWQLVAEYIDAGRSGKSIKGRPELQRLLADVGSFDRVVFWKLDRLGRNLRDLLAISDQLEAVGVGIVSIQESIDTGTATGRMLRNIIGSLAEFERETIVERIRFGMQQMQRQGIPAGVPSLGYARNGRSIVPEPHIAPVIRELYERYATGAYSLRDLAAWGRDQGLVGQRGSTFDRMALRKVLTNPVYQGDVVIGKRSGGGSETVPGDFEPIVTRSLFARVQQQLQTRRHADPVASWGRQAYPLTGTAVCGTCGAPLSGCMANQVRQRYMRCSTAARNGRGACSQPMVRAERLELQLRAYVGGMVLPRLYMAEIIAAAKELMQGERDEQREQQLERETERWRRLYVTGDIDEARYRRETAELQRELSRLRNAADTFDPEKAMYYLRNGGALWAATEQDRQAQREFVRTVFDRIVVQGENLTELRPKAAYAPLFMLDRRERFAGDVGVVWLPEQVASKLNYTHVLIPALSLPGAA